MVNEVEAEVGEEGRDGWLNQMRRLEVRKEAREGHGG